MNLNIEDLRVLITAGADGIGRKIAEAFLLEGAKVFVCDLSEKALELFASRNPSVGSYRCDVSDENDVVGMIGSAVEFLGGIDCLVNNAGSSGPTAAAEDISSEEWDRCVSINLTSTFNCSRLAMPYLRKSNNASIVSMSSAAGKMGYPNKAPYVAAKWGVIGLMKTLSIELGGDGVRCNAILPGPVEGLRMRGIIAEKAALSGITPEQQTLKYLSNVSIKALVKPEEIADLIVFLSSKRAGSISGQAISIDGDLRALV